MQVMGGLPGGPGDAVSKFGQKLMASAGPRSTERTFLRDKGILPEDPDWRPDNFWARAAQDASILAGQTLSGAGAVRLFNAAGQGAKNVFAGQNAPFFGPKNVNQGLTPWRDLTGSVAGGVLGSAGHSLTPANSSLGDMPENTGMALGSIAPYAPGWSAIPPLASRAYNAFKPGATLTAQRLADTIGKSPGALSTEFREINEGVRNAPFEIPDKLDFAPGAFTKNKPGIENAPANLRRQAGSIDDLLTPAQRAEITNLMPRAEESLGRLDASIKQGAPADTLQGYEEQAASLRKWLGESRPLLSGIPDYAPSPGAITGNKKLLGEERRAADNSTPITDPLNPGERISPANLRARNEGAVQEGIRTAAPEGVPERATTEIQERIAHTRDLAAKRAALDSQEAATLDDNARKAQEAVDAQMPGIPPGERTAAKAKASQELTGAIDTQHRRNARDVGRIFDDLDPAENVTVTFQSLPKALRDIETEALRVGQPNQIPSMMRKPKDADGVPIGDKIDDYLHEWKAIEGTPEYLFNVPFARVQGLRTNLQRAQRKAKGSLESIYIGKLIDALDDDVVRSAGGVHAENYALARDLWRTTVVKPYREGVVGRLLRGDKEFTTGDTLLPLGPRGAENIEQLVPEINASPALHKSLNDFAKADMVSYATDINGRVRSDKLKEWVEKSQPMLKNFPELQTEFTRLSNAQRMADDFIREAAERSPVLKELAKQGVKNTEDSIRNSATRFFLDGAEPEEVIERLLKLSDSTKRREAATEIMGMLKTREAKEGFSRAYYDSIVKRVLGGENRPDVKGSWSNTFTNTLDKESDIAEIFLTGALRERLKGLDLANVMNKRRNNATANVGSRTREDAPAEGDDMNANQRIVHSLRSDLLAIGGGAVVGGAIGSIVPGVGTLAGAGIGGGMGATGAMGGTAGKRLMQARTAAKEAALREMVFNADLYEKGMSQAMLAPAVKRMLAKKIRPYVLIANTEAVNDSANR